MIEKKGNERWLLSFGSWRVPALPAFRGRQLGATVLGCEKQTECGAGWLAQGQNRPPNVSVWSRPIDAQAVRQARAPWPLGAFRATASMWRGDGVGGVEVGKGTRSRRPARLHRTFAPPTSWRCRVKTCKDGPTARQAQKHTVNAGHQTWDLLAMQ
jgi:hypothetical protein